ncbi:hypothetical protein [uncultured Ruminococcus sp.]|uniref:hypothetical protein n=1 Tax=uncultured Ruminococcus sp. TaxID=165186 RepID=UPI00260DC76E|nr:hypothetical protein [uncultured Ruminococcus sp.]
MNNLKCPNCGGKLDKSPRGEYIYTCQFCGIDVDIQQHLSVDLDSKKRFCKAAHTHIQNGNFKNAEIMLERLELEYPFDKEVQDLRKMYDAAYNEEQDRLKREREQREYNRRREEIIEQIKECENDKDFWTPESGCIDERKLEKHIHLLEQAEHYKIECRKFCENMWKVLEDTKKGIIKLKINETSEGKHRFYNMFIMAHLINNNEIELEKRKNNLKESPVKWRKAMNNRIKCGFVFIVFFILLLFFSKSVKDDLALYLGEFFGLIGGWIIIYTLFAILVYQLPNSFFKKIIAGVKEQEETERKMNDDISEIRKILDEICRKYDYIEKEYKEITLNKSHG